MHQEVLASQVDDLIEEIRSVQGVCFDPNSLELHGLYNDELCAHRTKKVWTEVFETHFFLEPKCDFQVKVAGKPDTLEFVLTCKFNSAAARYAFWRLTHNQAPEAQYTLESAHLPSAGNEFENYLASPPDMTPLVDDPGRLGDDSFTFSHHRKAAFHTKLIKQLRCFFSR